MRLKRKAWAPWMLAAVVGCSAAQKPTPSPPPCPSLCGVQSAAVAGLRVAVSERATNVCVAESGCLGEPRGSIRITPLQPPIQRAIAEALQSVGFELVAGDAERDVVAGVEWHGTDTLRLRLVDSHGRLIDQVTYRRSLEPCATLPELTWDTCWAANFERMKLALSRPLGSSPAVLAFARKAKGVVTEPAAATVAVRPDVASEVGEAILGERLSEQQIQETVARYREQVQRGCWLPAQEAREPTAPSAARVSTAITVGASGSVLDVKAGGDPVGYPRLAECIASQLRTWRFPAAKNATTAAIPFVFAGGQ